MATERKFQIDDDVGLGASAVAACGGFEARHAQPECVGTIKMRATDFEFMAINRELCCASFQERGEKQAS